MRKHNKGTHNLTITIQNIIYKIKQKHTKHTTIYTMIHYRTKRKLYIYIYIYIYTQLYIIETEEYKKNIDVTEGPALFYS
jgi:hypothetical protein